MKLKATHFQVFVCLLLFFIHEDPPTSPWYVLLCVPNLSDGMKVNDTAQFYVTDPKCLRCSCYTVDNITLQGSKLGTFTEITEVLHITYRITVLKV